jgi:haloacetate dehalogenase
LDLDASGGTFPVPEELVGRSPHTIIDYALDNWSEFAGAFPPEVRREYVDKLSEPTTVHAICEQYRAAATLDCQLDEADRCRVSIACPVLALWARGGAVDQWYEPLDVWGQWADDVRGRPVDAGHFLPEEPSTEVVEEFLAFFAE